VETNYVYCYDTINNRDASSEALCVSAVGEKPGTERVCEVYIEGCNPYQYGSWSDCSATCGEGVMTRTVTCSVNTGVCIGSTMSIQACFSNSAECSYNWVVSAWSSCTVTCGYGVQTRTFACATGVGTLAANSLCVENVGPDPTTSQTCDSGVVCEDEWSIGEWSDCSVTCGLGAKTREVLCLSSTTGATIENNFCGQTTPVSTACCYEAECLAWIAGGWGSCTNGVNTRSVNCRSTTDNARYADIACVNADCGEIPDKTKTC
jgi:hypothetical protein